MIHDDDYGFISFQELQQKSKKEQKYRLDFAIKSGQNRLEAVRYGIKATVNKALVLLPYLVTLILLMTKIVLDGFSPNNHTPKYIVYIAVIVALYYILLLWFVVPIFVNVRRLPTCFLHPKQVLSKNANNRNENHDKYEYCKYISDCIDDSLKESENLKKKLIFAVHATFFIYFTLIVYVIKIIYQLHKLIKK